MNFFTSVKLKANNKDFQKNLCRARRKKYKKHVNLNKCKKQKSHLNMPMFAQSGDNPLFNGPAARATNGNAHLVVAA